MKHLDNKKKFELALKAQTGGDTFTADALYRSILQISPDEPMANHNLGVLLLSLGEASEGVKFITKALEKQPTSPQFWISKIDALIKLKQYDEAKATLKLAEESSALNIDLKDVEDSITEHIHTISKELNPKQGLLSNIEKLYSSRKYQEVVNLCGKLIYKYPNSAVLCNYVGAAYLASKQNGRAVKKFKRSVELDPKNTKYLINLGVAYKACGRVEQAEECFDTSMKIAPNFYEGYFNKGGLLLENGNPAAAVEYYKTAIKLKPNYERAHNNLGSAYKSLYKKSEAINSFERAISINPNYATAHRLLSTLIKYNPTSKHFQALKNINSDPSLQSNNASQIKFALAKAYEDIGNFDEAFSLYDEANRLRRQYLSYDPLIDKEIFRLVKSQHHLISNFDFEPNINGQSIRPIFILGMPRSGTTLLEQIISSHRDVTGGGELKFFGGLAAKCLSNFQSITKEDLHNLRHTYLSKLAGISNGKPIVTDKMPSNFLYINLIRKCLPEAKIIHSMRDPGAICWSNFRQYFGEGGINFAYSLEDLVNYYQLYRELMDFWNSEYPSQIINNQYENLTAKPEEAIRQLISDLGLGWDNSCLQPEENKRTVKTASQQQVSKKIYTGSSERWHQFSEHLSVPFKDLYID